MANGVNRNAKLSQKRKEVDEKMRRQELERRQAEAQTQIEPQEMAPVATEIPVLEPSISDMEKVKDLFREANTSNIPTREEIINNSAIPMLEMSKTLQEQNASRNEQRRAERDRRASLPVERETVEVPMEEALERYSSNVNRATVDRKGTLSENGQKEVDRLSKRIESLQRTPMTGDAAIDEVTQSNNQSEIADLQRQIDSIYETDNSERSANVDRYLDSNRKLSKYEKNEANAIFEEYLNNNPKAKELYNTNDAAMSSLLAQRFTPDEAEEYAKMLALKNKVSGLNSAGLGFVESMPFVKGLSDKSTKLYGERIDRDLSDYDYSSMLEQAELQNPGATKGANLAYNVGAYLALAPLFEGIPVVGKAAETAGKAFKNPVVGNAVSNIVKGQAADFMLDTAPNAIINDIMEGNWKDIPKDTLINQGENLVGNILGEAGGMLLNRFLGPKIPKVEAPTSQVDDAVRQTVDPAELAAKNEIDAAAKTDVVNEAVEEIENLSKQVPEVPEEKLTTEEVDALKRGNEAMEQTADNAVQPNRDLENGIRQSINDLEMSPEIRAEVEDRIKNIDTILDRIDNAKSMDELMAIADEGDAMIRDVDQLLKDSAQSRLIGKYQFDEDTKNFIEAINGTTIKVPDNMRAEFPDQTLKQLQAKLHFYGEGKNYGVNLRKNSGTPIESLFEDIDNATGHALSNFMESQGYNVGSPEGQMRALIEYADSLKANQNTSKVMDYNGGIFKDYADEYVKRLDDKAYALKNAGGNMDEAAKELPVETKQDLNAVGKVDEQPKTSEVIPENNTPNGPNPPDEEVIDLTQEARGDLRERGLSRHIRDEAYAFIPKTKGNVKVKDNGYINISFDKMPDADTIAALKDRGYKWDAKNKTWYAKNTANRMELADSIKTGSPIRSKNMMKMANVSDQVQADFRDNPDMYNALKNADTKQLAQDIYDSGDTPVSINGKVYRGNAETKFRSLLDEKNPAALPLGDQIAKDYSDAGNHDMAAQIYRDMGAALTDSGRFSQAAILTMMKNDPLTALAYFEKELRGLNKAGAEKYGKKWHDFVLTKEERALFDNITPGDTEAIKKAYDTIGKRIEKEYPVTFWEKVLEFRRVAMLFNTRTIVRNTLANPPTAVMRALANRIEAVGQHAAHLINPDIDVNQALLGANKASRNMARDVFDSDLVQSMIKDGPGRLSEIPKVGDYAKSKQIFKGGFVSDWINRMTDGGIEKLNAKIGKEGASSVGELWRNSAYKALEVTDNPMVKSNFVARLGSYIKAKGIQNIDDIPDEAIRMAYEEAMKATYKDNSWLVNSIRKFKGGIAEFGNNIHQGLGDVASQSLIPYVQAPGNIGARVIDYSPVGATKGIAKIIDGAKEGSSQTIQQGIEELSKGLSGSALAVVGAALYNSGILTGAYSTDDDQKAFEKQHGFREFAIRYKVNGKTKYDTIDWAQPFVDVIMMGALLAQAIQESDEYDSDILRYFGHKGTTAGKLVGGARETARKEVNYFFNATPLKSLGDLFAGRYGEPDIAENVWKSTVENFASGLVPAQLNAIAKTIDPTQRQTYNPDNTFGTFLNSIQAKLPGKSDDLAPKYDTWGQPMTYGNNSAEAGFAKMLYPGEHTSDKADWVDDEINRLFDETGSNTVFPMVAPKKVGDTKLNDREYSAYQQDMGVRSREVVEALLNSDAYNSMNDTEKANAIASIYGMSKAITERDLFGKEPADTYKKLIDAFDSGKAEGVLQSLQGSALAKAAGQKTNSKVGEAINAAIQDGDNERAAYISETSQTLSEYGLKPSAQMAYIDRAAELIPGLDANTYGNLFSMIDGYEGNGKTDGEISQKEIIAALPSLLDQIDPNNKMTDAQKQATAMDLYQSFYTDYADNSKVPEMQADGTFKAVARKDNADTQTVTQSSKQGFKIESTPQQTVTTLEPEYQPSATNNSQYNDIADVWSSMRDAGLSTSGASPYWKQASAKGATPQQFADYYNAIDSALGKANGGINMEEWAAYLNNNGLDEDEDRRIIDMLYNTRWRKLKYVKNENGNGGTWYTP